MRRTICWAVFALLVSSEGVFAQRHIAPRPLPRVIMVHRFHPACFFPYLAPVPILNSEFYSIPYYSGPSFVPTSPAYLFVGSDTPARPQLVFNDGTTYAVSDYWRVGDQLHFITVEEGGTKSVPHSVAFDSLDVQKTKDAAAAQGFRFVVRDKPIQQWLEHRAQQQHTPSRRTKPTAKG